MSNISNEKEMKNLSINEKDEEKIQTNKNNKDATFDKCVPSDSSDGSGGEEFFDAHEIPIVEESHEKEKDDNLSSFPNSTLATTVGSVPETNNNLVSSNSIRNEPSPRSSSIDPIETATTKSIDSKINSIPSIENSGDGGVPLPPPRTKKKKTLTKNTTAIHCENFENQSTSNHSSAESRSVTNSIESTSIHHNPYHNQNLASFLDDIASIKGDLSITEADNDKQSTYGDFIPNISGKSLIGNQELAFSNEQLSKLKEISKNYIFKQQQIQSNIDNNSSATQQESATASTTTTSSGTTTTNNSVLNQVMVMDHDTGEKVPLSRAENILPKCLNPLSLHLMKLTNTELDDNATEKEQSSSSIADSTFKSVTSLISNTLIEMKIEKKDRTLEKKNKKKLLEACEPNCDEFEDDDDEDEDYKNSDYKDGGIRSKIKDLKRIVPGLIKNVKGVKTPSSKKRSTFHVDPGEVDVVPPAPPRYKIKVNHKRGTADFDGLKLIQEINDCKGAIWCMKFSNCSQLLAAAGQDHLLRVYCCQKSWKYFTQLRNKASSGQQHNSPTSTKERSGGGSNGDSFGRVQTSQKSSSYSRNGSLNTCDSHNNSSSSSNSSALNKEFYKDEDNTLSEEGPLLLFTIYRGHTADVLDLAWSKNHFILSSSMDKTVRLWHITRIECLCTFRHIDFVTTIQFHPRDDRYFLSGSLDGKLRLWNIPDKRVTLWNEVPALPSQRENNVNDSDMNPSNGLITASSFVQNGKFAVIGTYDGRIIFYTTDQLKYFTQIHVNSKNMGSTSQSGASTRRFRTNKVTGVESIDITNKILVTTNDSRLRLYDLRDLSLTCKYKGCINQSSQIKAAVSHDQKYIICGSENNSFYIWRVQDNSTIGQRRDRNKQYECIRLLNLPTSQSAPLPPPPPPPPPSTMEKDSNLDNNSSTLSYPHGGNSTTTTNSTSNTNTSNQKSVVSSKVTSGGTSGGSSSGFDHSTTTSASNNIPASSSNTTQASSSYSSNAATKIVTSAIFASVPSQIEDKARYIIAAADFNGYIRIFSKQ